MTDRKDAERRVGLAKLWARAKQIVTTDPTGSDDDDRMVDEEAARALAAHAGRLKGGLAKVAQLAAYHDVHAGRGARAVLGGLWDRAPAVSAADISRVVEADLGKPPQQLFASWEGSPLAAASLGQVHAATTRGGEDVVVKVQYPGVAESLRADLDDDAFVRRLAGGEIGATLDTAALRALAEAVRRELDYRAEAAAMQKFADAWAGDASLRVPRPIAELSTARVLTMTRARGKTIVDVASAGDADVRRQAATAIFRFAWGSPLAHGLLDADPNPGNFLVDVQGDGHALVWCLDFGCTVELPPAVRDADRAIHFGLLDDDSETAAERFRMGLSQAGLLARKDSLATLAHRDWERALALPLQARGEFAWTPAYTAELSDATRRVLAAGGLRLTADLLLLWRQRLGASALLGLLDAKAPFRRPLLDLIGSGKRALR
jgi:predicted unusual protein kinase regulating ubiquinone biosynthesis (AarF/ABC1/UbiB family)|nr:AarF/ABC1/UbiB kinase family protein [Kofleriaceae bacterium]